MTPGSSYLNGLPNKFFEMVQARLALAVSPNPEMVYLVKKYELGVAAEGFTAKAMAEVINNLTGEMIAHYKIQSHINAQALSAGENIKKLGEVIQGLVSE